MGGRRLLWKARVKLGFWRWMLSGNGAGRTSGTRNGWALLVPLVTVENTSISPQTSPVLIKGWFGFLCVYSYCLLHNPKCQLGTHEGKEGVPTEKARRWGGRHMILEPKVVPGACHRWDIDTTGVG